MAAGSSEKAPLLVNTEDEYGDGFLASTYPKEAALALPNERARGVCSLSAGKPREEKLNDSIASPSAIPSAGHTGVARQLRVQDNIVAIFVVAFDTHRGNIIEWCQPEDVNLEGVEFKAMASGAHTVVSDFIYFRKDDYYGLSCFENMHVDSAEERGARMKSVGILATTYTTLYRHMQFLENQVRHQLETPGIYTQLQAFYDDRKGSLPSSRELSGDNLSASSLSPAHRGGALSPPPSEDLIPNMKITHPAGCFAQFLNFFGDQIFVLWKYVLLQKRIVFFSPPPIGVVCFRVYCACLLGAHDIALSSGTETKPFFYINIADIDMLESEVSYIACTTEKIFEEKKSLHDVYVDNQNVTAHTTNLKEMKKLNAMDREKFNKLNNQRQDMQELGESREIDDDHLFATFFLDQNNHIFQTLLDVSTSEDRAVTTDHMKAMGLDPVGDRQFLMDLIELYGIDVIMMVDNPCCPV
ncbi:DENN domain-containing protein 11-like [Amphiura filiformis]|uniref:DENN domain-containing protein 11-like n=1 Tax=Amphiura filiformis TaxID=82378 RepID=UPI003B221BAC